VATSSLGLSLSSLSGTLGVGSWRHRHHHLLLRWRRLLRRHQKLTQSAAGANLFWDETNKRLGIGTASPSQKLQIESGSAQITAGDLIFGQAGTSYIYNSNAAGLLGFLTGSNGAFTFGVNGGGELLRITNTGSVGIGTVSPRASSKLDAAGPVILGEISSGDNGRSYFDNSGGARFIQWNNAGALTNFLRTDGVSYLNGGNVGIGTTSPPRTLSVSGNSYVTGTAGFGVSAPSTYGGKVQINFPNSAINRGSTLGQFFVGDTATTQTTGSGGRLDLGSYLNGVSGQATAAGIKGRVRRQWLHEQRILVSLHHGVGQQHRRKNED
jgi:hypothetical protein